MFHQYIRENNLQYIISPPEFVKMLPAGSYEVLKAIKDILSRKVKVLVVPDPDPDGFFSAKCWDVTFRTLGYTNYNVMKLVQRIHTVNIDTVQQHINEGCRAVIIVDSSTNDIALIEHICAQVDWLIIIDHHESPFKRSKFPVNCIIVNPCIESRQLPYATFSAGMLNAMICDYILSNYGITNKIELYIYGFITLYSDSCVLENPMTVSFMRTILHNHAVIPQILQPFWNDFSSYNRNFVSFKLVPTLNALIRCGRFDLIDKLFFHMHEIHDLIAFGKEISDTTVLAKQKLKDLLDMVVVANTPSIAIGTIPHDLDPIYYNFNGLVAQNLATMYGKPALCIHEVPENRTYVGSARDPLGRDLLSEASTIVEAAGHDAAFGVVIPKHKLEILPEYLEGAELKVKEKEKIFDYTDLISNQEIRDMAIYNEYTGHILPKVLIRIRIGGEFKLGGTSARSTATLQSAGLKIVMFNGVLQRYSEVIAEPRFNGENIECIVQKG